MEDFPIYEETNDFDKSISYPISCINTSLVNLDDSFCHPHFTELFTIQLNESTGLECLKLKILNAFPGFIRALNHLQKSCFGADGTMGFRDVLGLTTSAILQSCRYGHLNSSSFCLLRKIVFASGL